MVSEGDLAGRPHPLHSQPLAALAVLFGDLPSLAAAGSCGRGQRRGRLRQWGPCGPTCWLHFARPSARGGYTGASSSSSCSAAVSYTHLTLPTILLV
eukprot:7867796-Pyramimonas_sp.AAC.1